MNVVSFSKDMRLNDRRELEVILIMSEPVCWCERGVSMYIYIFTFIDRDEVIVFFVPCLKSLLNIQCSSMKFVSIMQKL